MSVDSSVRRNFRHVADLLGRQRWDCPARCRPMYLPRHWEATWWRMPAKASRGTRHRRRNAARRMCPPRPWSRRAARQVGRDIHRRPAWTGGRTAVPRVGGSRAEFGLRWHRRFKRRLHGRGDQRVRLLLPHSQISLQCLGKQLRPGTASAAQAFQLGGCGQLLGFLGRTGPQEWDQGRRNAGEVRLLMHNAVEQHHRRVLLVRAGKRAPSRRRVHEHRSQREDVTRRTRFPGNRMLRRQIAGGTDHASGPRVTRVLHRARYRSR